VRRGLHNSRSGFNSRPGSISKSKEKGQIFVQEGFTIQLREPQQERQLVPLATLAYAIAQESLEVNRHAASIGRLLIQAKEQLPDDKGFMEWVQENCRFSHSTALNLMKFARGVEETPALQGHSQSFVLEVLKLPAAEREQFAQEHEGDSVRKIRELIAERDKARQDADRAEKARLRIEEGFQEAAKKLDEVASQRDFFKQQYEAVGDQPPETIEVEVPVEVVPEDYDELKRRAADAESREDELLRQVKDAQARADDAENRAQDAEEEAEKQEQLRRQAQSELRKLRDADGDPDADGDSPFSSKHVGEAVQGLISQLGTLPHMGALFRSVPKAEIDEITRWLNVAIEWAENSKRAINSIQGFIDDDSDYSVK
jgi:hypothetical protein